MPAIWELRILLPTVRDSDRAEHAPAAVAQFEENLIRVAGGLTLLPGLAVGVWKDTTGKRVYDKNRCYLVGIAREHTERIRELLRKACEVFDQRSIYLSVAGRVEFVSPRLTAATE